MNKLAELEYNDRGVADLKIGETGWTIRAVRRKGVYSGWPQYATYFMHDTCDKGHGWASDRECYKCEEPVPKQAIVFNKLFKLRI